jgi:hypothetical protein
MAVGLRDSRRISQELNGLQGRPKRLDQLGNELVENRTIINTVPRILGCCNDRENTGNSNRRMRARATSIASTRPA